MNRPEKSEYAAFYETYVALVEETDIISALENQIAEVEKIFAAIPEEKADYAYAEGKWSIRQMLGHIIDGERIFAYRALRFSRGDETALPGFEENFYVDGSNFQNAKLADLLAQLTLLRQANVLMFKNLTEEMWTRTGTASENAISVRAIAYISVGHIRHHLRILRERYLV